MEDYYTSEEIKRYYYIGPNHHSPITVPAEINVFRTVRIYDSYSATKCSVQCSELGSAQYEYENK